jgi:predicted secreted protein
MTGKDITVIIAQNGTALASTRIKSNDIKNKCDVIEKASANQQTWKEYIAGRSEWSINVGYLVLAAPQVRNVLLVRQTFDLTFTANDGTDTETLTGKAILTAADIKANSGSLAQGTFAFQGTGPLSSGQ